MGRKFSKKISFFLLSFLLIHCFFINTSAYKPENSFTCEVDRRNIPPNTKYIDFLLPIRQTDDCYVDYNEENGEKFGISDHSEIVEYCEDGYRSYTFHVADAASVMVPTYDIHFEISKELYDQNQKLFAQVENLGRSTEQSEDENVYYFNVDVESNTEQEKKLLEIAEKCDIDLGLDDNAPTVCYNSEYERSTYSDYDYEYCCKEYGYAKLAYLDKDGNVILVTNKVDIDRFSLSDVQLNLSVSGNEFSSDPENGPPYYLMALIYIILPIVIVLVLIAVIVILIVRARKIRVT